MYDPNIPIPAALTEAVSGFTGTENTHPVTAESRHSSILTKGECSFDTREIRNVLGKDIPFNEPSVAGWLQEALKEEIDPIFGGL